MCENIENSSTVTLNIANTFPKVSWNVMSNFTTPTSPLKSLSIAQMDCVPHWLEMRSSTWVTATSKSYGVGLKHGNKQAERSAWPRKYVLEMTIPKILSTLMKTQARSTHRTTWTSHEVYPDQNSLQNKSHLNTLDSLYQCCNRRRSRWHRSGNG